MDRPNDLITLAIPKLTAPSWLVFQIPSISLLPFQNKKQDDALSANVYVFLGAYGFKDTNPVIIPQYQLLWCAVKI